MSQDVREDEHGRRDDVVLVDYLRFVRDARDALPASTLGWADRIQVNRDLAALVVEARDSRRPELLGVLVRCVCQLLDRGAPTIAATVQLRDTDGAYVGGSSRRHQAEHLHGDPTHSLRRRG